MTRLIQTLFAGLAMLASAIVTLPGAEAGVVFNGTLNSATSSSMTDRINRTTPPLTCATQPKAFPGNSTNAGTFFFATTTLSNPTGAPVCKTLNYLASSSCGSNSVYVSVYSAAFQPGNRAANYLGDIGDASGSLGSSMSVLIGAGQTIHIVVNTTSPAFSGSCNFTITDDPPSITTANPNGGNTTGGNSVTINGANLKGATSVTFGGTPATITNNTSPTSVVATAPAHAAGDVTISVTNPGGTATKVNGYTYSKLATTTAMTLSANPSTFGAGTATVTVNAAVGAPTGTVRLVREGNITIATAALNGGPASLSYASLSVGVHQLTAIYDGDSNYASNSNGPVIVTVNKAATATSLTVSPNPANTLQTVVLTATVTGPGGTPTGTVTFREGATVLATPGLASGQTTLTLNGTSAGTHPYTATYNGSASYETSVSGTVTETIEKAPVTVTLTSSQNPGEVGEPLILTATLGVPAGSPTGTVDFQDGATTFGTASVSNGKAVLSTTALSAGVHTITASYSGDSRYGAATSARLGQTMGVRCNDSIGGGLLPGSNGVALGSNVGATGQSEFNEPNHGGVSLPLNSVWCAWQAPAAGPVTFDTTGSDFDTVLAVYTAGNGALTLVKDNDDLALGVKQSRVTFMANADQQFFIAIDGRGAATGNYLLNYAQTPSAPTLVAAVLPTTRSVVTGTIATAFGTVINTGTTAATLCYPMLPPGFPGTFTFQTTNAANVPIGSPNSRVGIPAGAAQSFVFGVTPSVNLDSADVGIVFDCANTDPAAVVAGLDTFGLTASAAPTPDLIAIGATPTNDGILTVPPSGFGFFSASAVNIGVSGSITATVDDNGKSLPLSVTLCRTDPATGTCVTPASPGPSTTSTIAKDEIATYAVFVQATGPVTFDPANNRLFLRLRTPDGTTRGATSVAVKPQ